MNRRTPRLSILCTAVHLSTCAPRRENGYGVGMSRPPIADARCGLVYSRSRDYARRAAGPRLHRHAVRDAFLGDGSGARAAFTVDGPLLAGPRQAHRAIWRIRRGATGCGRVEDALDQLACARRRGASPSSACRSAGCSRWNWRARRPDDIARHRVARGAAVAAPQADARSRSDRLGASHACGDRRCRSWPAPISRDPDVKRREPRRRVERECRRRRSTSSSSSANAVRDKLGDVAAPTLAHARRGTITRCRSRALDAIAFGWRCAR